MQCRAKAEAHDIALEESYAYTDSFYDAPLLSAVGTPIVVNPDPRMVALALLRRWPILNLDVSPGVVKIPVLGVELQSLALHLPDALRKRAQRVPDHSQPGLGHGMFRLRRDRRLLLLQEIGRNGRLGRGMCGFERIKDRIPVVGEEPDGEVLQCDPFARGFLRNRSLGHDLGTAACDQALQQRDGRQGENSLHRPLRHRRVMW